MRKIFTILLAVVMMAASAVRLSASDKFVSFGVKAGLDFTNMTKFEDIKKDGFFKTYTGFNAGVLLNLNLPLGFEVQPELLYVQTGINSKDYSIGSLSISENSVLRTGSLRLPVNVMWGINILGVVKPFVMVAPYIGCALYTNGKLLGIDISNSDFKSRLEYGVGLGFGVTVWKIQASFKWNWTLSPYLDSSKFTIPAIKDQVESAKLQGGEISLAFIF